jgi:hypothetical protein
VVRGPAKGRDHVLLFWLRLPLSEDGGRVDRILCHDMAGPSERDTSRAEYPLLHHPRIQVQPRALARRLQVA